MRTAVTAGACLALLAFSAHADAPAPAPPDLAAEISWARATWPGTFDGVHFHAPIAKLRAWVARGPVAVYLFNDDFACRAATLLPGEPPSGDAAEPGPMTAKIVGPSHVEDGRTLREVTYVSVDLELSREDGFAHEAKGEDGRWRLVDSGGYSIPPTIYGALSSADDRIARWGGALQVIRPYCDGPFEWLACAGGGERPCLRCEEVAVMIVGPGSFSGRSRSHASRPVTCHDPCPQYPESPSIKRLRALSARAALWSANKQPLAAVPSLYRSREDCLREHPRIDRARKRCVTRRRVRVLDHRCQHAGSVGVDGTGALGDGRLAAKRGRTGAGRHTTTGGWR